MKAKESVFHKSVTFAKRIGTKQNEMTRNVASFDETSGKSNKMCHPYMKADLKTSLEVKHHDNFCLKDEIMLILVTLSERLF
jgi:hypothetical protein